MGNINTRSIEQLRTCQAQKGGTLLCGLVVCVRVRV